MYSHLAEKLSEQSQAGLWRNAAPFSSLEGNMIDHDGRVLLNMSSNDYLGLSQAPEVLNAAINFLSAQGQFGGTASRYVCGYHPIQKSLEEAMAEHFGYEKAYLFPNGYMANQALFQVLLDKNSIALLDKYCHISLIQGAQQAEGGYARFKHNDVGSLDRLYHVHEPDTAMVVTEGVFSMEGNLAPLADLSEWCQQHNSLFIVDDAHGVGVLGESGRGTADHIGIDRPDIVVCPFGKAFGTYGACILTDQLIWDTIAQFSKAACYSTSPPPVLAAATLAALGVMQSEPWRQTCCHDNVVLFQSLTAHMPQVRRNEVTPIQIVDAPSIEVGLRWHEALLDAGYWCPVIRPPTVQATRLRLVLNALHQASDIRDFTGVLEQIIDG